MILELMARFSEGSSFSTRLTRTAMLGHGIGMKDASGGLALEAASNSQPNGRIIGGKFFVDLQDESIWRTYQSQFRHKLKDVQRDAERLCRHEFDVLGSGLIFWGTPINWHRDVVSGYCWPKKLGHEVKKLKKAVPNCDVKVPWELSRMQHLPTLGKAYRLTQESRYAREMVQQINHWIEENPCPYGVNWICPMEVAIRILNILWGYAFIEDCPEITSGFRDRLRHAVFQHGQFILYNLEYGIQNDGSITRSNHYLTDIVGLLHLGLLCPGVQKADLWSSVGIKGLTEEMDYQIYDDGGDFESSIPYHRLAVELFTAGALLCRLNGVRLPEEFWKKLERMYEFVLYLIRPDGKAPQVGDADDGRLYILSDYGSWDRTDFRYMLSTGAVLFNRGDMKAQSHGFSEDSFWLLGPAGLKAFNEIQCDRNEVASKAFFDSGLYVMRQGETYLVACCGAVGTGGLGNHKHNDLLSFELYFGNRALIVDPGSYVYSRDPEWRNLFRSTAYHNTVVIDGQEQNRFDPEKTFRMYPDASVIVNDWLSTPEVDRLDVEHRGYARLSQPVSHRRTFLFDKQKCRYEITDVLNGNGQHEVDWYVHFDHDVEVRDLGQGVFRTSCEGINLELTTDSTIPMQFELLKGWVSRRYGQKLSATVLHAHGLMCSTCSCVFRISVI